ncbi:type IV secretion system protein [Lysobacter niabensis]|uniref:type IV secretion system protein n=1 Tax=Agrilutibacter niabensis TaxID=380628 RepID=UPI00362023D6
MNYLRGEIQDFGLGIMRNAMVWAGGIALTLLTLWIMIQGYRIVTGQSRDSMMLLVTNSLRATLIVGAATSMAAFGTDLHDFLTDDVNREINWIVTGDHALPEDRIDKNLGWMQVALSSIDKLDVVGDPTLDDDKTRAMWFVGLGTGGPALVGGTMLLLYEIALALFVGLGPLFILCLLFDQTKSLFGRWLQYGIGTMFSMAVLSAMVSISLEMVTRVAAAFWTTAAAGALLGQDFNDGMISQAMQQGGMGLILTTLIISAPPMAAMFFQGTLGSFSAFNAFDQRARAPGPGSVSPQTYSGGISTVGGDAGRGRPEAFDMTRSDTRVAGMQRTDLHADQIKVGPR